MHRFFFIGLLFTLNCCLGSTHGELLNYSHSLDKILDSLNIAPGSVHLHIDKSDFVLSVMADTLVVKQYPVVLGGNPVDDKLCQGDQCTPEGRFLVRAMYPHKEWNKFIWIDYPNEASWEKHRQAKEAGLLEASAGIGGEIGIHGVPRGTDRIIDIGLNWTLGCISLKNKDVDEIYAFINKGTTVIIQR